MVCERYELSGAGKMEEILRLMAVRPPEKMNGDSSIRIELNNGNVDLENLSGDGLPMLGELEEKLVEVRELIETEKSQKIKKSNVHKIFGGQGPETEYWWERAKYELDAAILGGKFKSGERRLTLAKHAGLRRAMEAVEVVGRGGDETKKDMLEKILNASFRIELEKAKIEKDNAKDQKNRKLKEQREEDLEKAKVLIRKHEALRKANDYLKSIPARDLEVHIEEREGGRRPEKKVVLRYLKR